MPSSRHAMMIRMAISPRFAIRIFLNIGACFYREQPLAVLHWLAVLDVNADDLSLIFGIDLVHQLYRFDDTEDLPLFHVVTDLNEGRGTRFGRPKEGSNDRRLHHRQIDLLLLQL